MNTHNKKRRGLMEKYWTPSKLRGTGKGRHEKIEKRE